MIKIVNLTKSFGGHKVLDGINLTMPSGQITVVIGKSGVGKSVLLKHIIGLLKPDSGQIFVDGQDMSLLTGRQLREFKRRFGVLFQGGALFDSLNVFENIAFPLREKTRLNEAEIAKRVRERLAQMSLTSEVEAKFPDELSGGMKKRAGLARAMALDPEILVIDEPSSGLDPLTARRLDDLILELRDSLETTIVVITHELASILGIGTNSVFLDTETHTMINTGNPKEAAVSGDPKVRHFLNRGAA